MALQAKEHIAEMKNRLIAVLRSVSDSFKSKKALIDTKDAAKNCGGALKNACLYTAKAVKAALTGQRQAVSSLTSPVARMRNAIKGGFKKMGGGLVRFGKGIPLSRWQELPDWSQAASAAAGSRRECGSFSMGFTTTAASSRRSLTIPPQWWVS